MNAAEPCERCRKERTGRDVGAGYGVLCEDCWAEGTGVRGGLRGAPVGVERLEEVTNQLEKPARRSR